MPVKGVSQVALLSLRGISCPAVMLEVGHLTNAHDRVLLRDSTVYGQVADAMAEAAVAMGLLHGKGR
jgi:N-acetylmuramoyl-L-alanine amidase